jgi:hypothetical protein
MRRFRIHQTIATLAATAALIGSPLCATAQGAGLQGANDFSSRSRASFDTSDTNSGSHTTYTFEDRADSLSWVHAHALADRAGGFRIVVSLQDKHLWAIVGKDTVLSAPAAVAKGTTLKFGKQQWTFKTPRGARTVLAKEADPIWQPPEWLYAETAKENDLKLSNALESHRPVKLSDGRLLAVRDGVVGVIDHGQFEELPTDEHIVFDNTLFVPPLGSKNRKVEGELGKYRLILGEGYLLHGTPYTDSIGLATTHGCVRLRDEDIEWLYEHVPVGTKVYIY